MTMIMLLKLCFFVVFFAGFLVEGKMSRMPLMDNDGTRPRNKSAECIFGKEVKELGSVWIPDLGPPIDVLYCMRCECIKHQKKRRIVAKVHCHNIKSECPEPTCEEPVLLPQRCCKTCNPEVGDLADPELVQDVVAQNVVEEEDRGSKHYLSLLSGRSSLVVRSEYSRLAAEEGPSNDLVATGRFTFHKKNLFYSLLVSERADTRPHALQFLDSDGAILEEVLLSTPGGIVGSVYQNTTRKVCGVWRRLPREYRRLLRQERLFVLLAWGDGEKVDLTVSGQLRRYSSLGTELFSGLLEPLESQDTQMQGAGGTAVIYTVMAVSPSIHVAVIFNGVFAQGEVIDVGVNVTLKVDDRRIVLQETVNVHKPDYDLNLIEISSPVTPADLRLLTRGRLIITVTSLSHPDSLQLNGNVIPKVACELFQTTLQSSATDRNNIYGTSGLAWLYLNNEGSLVYNVKVDNLRDTSASLTLVDTSTRRRQELEDLTPSFRDGWANGTIERLSPRVLEPLYEGNLAVNVATETDSSFLSGKLTNKPVADAKDGPHPFLMKREKNDLSVSAVGLAWLTVDNECHLHYDVSLNGFSSGNRNYILTLEMYPMIAPNAPVIDKLLDEFKGNQVEGSPVNSLTREELNRLDSGVSFLKVRDIKTKQTLLSATIMKVQIPSTCRVPITDNNATISILVIDSDDGMNNMCFHGGIFYEHESQWTTSDPCNMCYCQNGEAKCDTMICPEISCPNDQKVVAPGECCPVCTGNVILPSKSSLGVQQKCHFNGKSYSPGSKFHPFLIPIGFDSCTECNCDPVYLEIKCMRRNNDKQCCRNCNSNDVNGAIPGDDPDVIEYNISIPKKEAPMKTAEEILEEGGCRNPSDLRRPYENGTTYHPIIEWVGEYKCVTCRCTNSNQTCRRHHCDRSTCERIFQRRHERLPITDTDTCCSLRECKKKLRRRKKNRNQGARASPR